MTLPIMVNGEGADVSAILRSKYRNCPAAGYVTGGYPIEWSERQFDDFTRKIRIDQSANDPSMAKLARGLDVETGAAKPADIPGFIAGRPADLHYQTTIYCDVSTISEIDALVFPIRDIPRFWIAWWWNRPGIPTVHQVIDEIDSVAGVKLDAGQVWACQYRNAPQWELSVVYGDPDFDR